MIELYTDMYFPVLGDGQDGKTRSLPPMRKIVISIPPNNSKRFKGVIDGVQVDVRIDRVYRDENRTPVQKKWITDQVKSL